MTNQGEVRAAFLLRKHFALHATLALFILLINACTNDRGYVGPSPSPTLSSVNTSGTNLSAQTNLDAADNAKGQCALLAVGSLDRQICNACYTEVLTANCPGKTDVKECSDTTFAERMSNLINKCVVQKTLVGFGCTNKCTNMWTVLDPKTCLCVAVSKTVSSTTGNATSPDDQKNAITTTQETVSPTPPTPPSIPTYFIATGHLHTCAYLNGKTWCWGYNGNGELGVDVKNNDASSSFFKPLLVDQQPPSLLALAAGQGFTCGLVEKDHSVICWGDNTNGQIGNPNSNWNNRWQSFPVLMSNNSVLTDVASLALGDSHACALTTGGSIQCWGLNFEKDTFGAGSCGVADILNCSFCLDYCPDGICSSLPDKCKIPNCQPLCLSGPKTGPANLATATLLNSSSKYIKISAGTNFSCALATDGHVDCWSKGAPTPQPIKMSAFFGGATLTGVLELTSNDNVSCAQTADNTYCWGSAGSSLGYGTDGSAGFSIIASALFDKPYSLHSRSTTLCGLTDNTLKCAEGKSTLTNTFTFDKPVLSLGYSHGCAINQNGSVKCWGTNSSGELGNGTKLDSPSALVGVLF